MSGRHQRKSGSKKGVLGVLLLLACLLLGLFLMRGMFTSQQAIKRADHHKTSASSSKTSPKVSRTWQKQDQTVAIPILMYHAIHVMDPSEAANANLIVSPDLFDSHIKRLKEEGYYFLTPQEAYKALTENSLPAQKVVWLTFDDGNADFYSQAYPILKKYGAKATNNVITGFVENSRAGNLTVAQMTEMAKNGMSFQAHTVSHPDLSTQDQTSIVAELVGSKQFLDQNLSQDTIALAYPSGRYNDATLAAAEQSYKLAVTTNEGLAEKSDGLLSLDRVRVLPTMSADDLLASMQATN